MAEGNFFTTIKEPKRFRTELLQSSKEMIQILKDYQVLLHMREEKKAKAEQLKGEFEELAGLMQQLDDFMPDESVKELRDMMPQPEPEPEPEPEEAPVEEEPEPEPEPEPEEEKDPELEKLENALANIEKKLENI